MTTLALPSANTIDRLAPFDQLILGFLAKCKSEATLRAYQEDLKNYFAWCQQQRIDPLTVRRVHLDLYVGWMQEQHRWAEQTISRRTGTVCAMYKYGYVEELIEKDPAAGVERPTVDREKQHRTWLSAVELASLIKYSAKVGARERALVSLLGAMGLRVGEACSLEIENVTHARGYMVLNYIGKGNRAAHTDVPVTEAPVLERVMAGRVEGPILLNADGNRMDRAAAARMLRRLCEQADLPTNITPHSLRRSFVTTGLTKGISLYDMQRAARHKSPQTTTLYDMTASSPDRNATHQVASYLAALAG